jgi:hypothetical protein
LKRAQFIRALRLRDDLTPVSERGVAVGAIERVVGEQGFNARARGERKDIFVAIEPITGGEGLDAAFEHFVSGKAIDQITR